MASPATTATESRDQDRGGKSQVVIVDLEQPQSAVAVRRLRKGKGKLFNHVDQIVKDLVADGTVKANAQPVVILVHEIPAPFWAAFDDDDD
jgi:hypothetical protein